MRVSYCLAAGLAIMLSSPALKSAAPPRVSGKNIRIEFDQSLHSRVVAILDGKETPMGPQVASESIRIGGNDVADFNFTDVKQESVHDKLGAGKRYRISGTAPNLKKTIVLTVYDDFPRTVFYEVEYTNTGTSELGVEGWTNNSYSLSAGPAKDGTSFWSFEPGSYERRPNWVVPLKKDFKQENYLGMNAADYGGGTPVVDVWRPDVGLGVGEIEMVPKLVSLPVTMPDAEHATVAVGYKYLEPLKLAPKGTVKTFHTFVTVHRGDYFDDLQDFSKVMVKQGVKFNAAPASAFEPIWCAWGYGRNFTMDQVRNTFPIVKKLGFGWVTLDDGWQGKYGDWDLDKTKYPNGDKDMKQLVDEIHANGQKAQLWWAPMLTEETSQIALKHPEMLLINKDGSKEKVPYWKSWYVCPADPKVIAFFKAEVIKYMRDWGFDALKLDGQHMNGAPPCYNPAHHHARPEESVEAVPAFYKMIFDTAQSIKKDAVVEFCPCGDAYSFYMMPYFNMSVASDPTSSYQVRTKGKTLKALHGDSIAYFGDHVSLGDEGRPRRAGQPPRPPRDDFASTVGVGGVLGTNFSWPVAQPEGHRAGNLTPEKEEMFAKWLKIYREQQLFKGEYMGGLYDIGFDAPETHAVRRDKIMYYSFFGSATAPAFKGQVELRGLGNGKYHVVDYENGKDLGTVSGPKATVNVDFTNHLMLAARPE